jgi:hypothetical protein
VRRYGGRHRGADAQPGTTLSLSPVIAPSSAHAVEWPNVGLVCVIFLVGAGGTFYFVTNERRLRGGTRQSKEVT